MVNFFEHIRELRLKQELHSKVKDQTLNKNYDAGLPRYTLVYKDTIYSGHTAEEVVKKALKENLN